MISPSAPDAEESPAALQPTPPLWPLSSCFPDAAPGTSIMHLPKSGAAVAVAAAIGGNVLSGPLLFHSLLVEVQDGCVRLVLSLYPAGKGTWESEFSDCLLRLSGSKTHKLEFLNMGTWFQRKTTNKSGIRPPQGLHTTQILVPLLPWSRLLV